jgi:hypothetical protein
MNAIATSIKPRGTKLVASKSRRSPTIWYNNIDITKVQTVPETQVVFYQDDDGEVPVLEWLKKLLKQDRKAYANCVAYVEESENGEN